MSVYTPPKYQEVQLSREAPLKLEDRLLHFLMWLEQRHIYLFNDSLNVILHDKLRHAVVEEYVNG